ncbi:uncharacterized protein V1516DRAFT_676195 [Lipomyces oligophaga]|uniref:uncharacterized protein n=1 Tax=Lipomyces oligophaga TaxID=45792 RepID=UPI0034CF3BD8
MSSGAMSGSREVQTLDSCAIGTSRLSDEAQKAPRLTKNGVRVGRPPGSKNKFKPNGPKVGRPSLSTIFMSSSSSIHLSYLPDESSESNLQISDESRIRFNLLPFDPEKKSKHGYLAKRQKCQFAVIPVYTREERMLFAEFLREPGFQSSTWESMTKAWNIQADGRSVFYKTPRQLKNYFDHLSLCAQSYPRNPARLESTESETTELVSQRLAPDQSVAILAMAIAASNTPGLNVNIEAIVEKCKSLSLDILEDVHSGPKKDEQTDDITQNGISNPRTDTHYQNFQSEQVAAPEPQVAIPGIRLNPSRHHQASYESISGLEYFYSPMNDYYQQENLAPESYGKMGYLSDSNFSYLPEDFSRGNTGVHEMENINDLQINPHTSRYNQYPVDYADY